jgi:hypothetical protein
MPPFSRLDVNSYAMYPDGDGHTTILVSTKKKNKAEATVTFSFETGVSVWKNLGQWTLPFTDRGHYEPELGALVGISKDPEAFGYLYACDVPSTGNMHCPAPAWKGSREKVLSNNDPAEKHVSSSLIYLGYRRKFCLAECVLVEACEEVKEGNDDQVLLEKPQGACMCVPQMP